MYGTYVCVYIHINIYIHAYTHMYIANGILNLCETAFLMAAASSTWTSSFLSRPPSVHLPLDGNEQDMVVKCSTETDSYWMGNADYRLILMGIADYSIVDFTWVEKGMGTLCISILGLLLLLLLHSRLQTPTGRARCQKPKGPSREDSPVRKEKILERK